MWCPKLLLFLVFILAINAKKPSKSLIEEISEHKEFKKFLKTRNNILVYFYSSKIPTEISEIIKKVSESTKGLATLVTVDCSTSDGKKLCKKVKASKTVKVIFITFVCYSDNALLLVQVFLIPNNDSNIICTTKRQCVF